MLNSIIIMGRLTREPEIRKANNTNIATLTIAVDNFGKDKETSFFNAVILNEKVAKNVNEFTKKGDRVILSGRLQQRKYTTKDGDSRSVIEIVAENVEFIEPKEKVLNDDSDIQVAEEVKDSDLPEDK